MSFVREPVKLSVKTSNYSSVARFASTLDEAYLLIVANSNNDYSYNDSNNAGIFGANSWFDDNATRYETTYTAAGAAVGPGPWGSWNSQVTRIICAI